MLFTNKRKRGEKPTNTLAIVQSPFYMKTA